MPDLNYIYNHEADQYQRLVDYEDYEGNLLRAIEEIIPLKNIDVLETGAGTGRVTCLLAPLVRSLRSFDLSPHMLSVAQSRLDKLDYHNVQLAVSDHRRLPMTAASVDLIIAGWSLCYVYVDGGSTWRATLDQTLADFQHFLRPCGKIIIIETLGTGTRQPMRIPSLAAYLNRLDEIGLQLKSIRTDFCFENNEQARELTVFFFGDEMLDKLEDCILPECTGLWWQEKRSSPTP